MSSYFFDLPQIQQDTDEKKDRPRASRRSKKKKNVHSRVIERRWKKVMGDLKREAEVFGEIDDDIGMLRRLVTAAQFILGMVSDDGALWRMAMRREAAERVSSALDCPRSRVVEVIGKGETWG